MAAAEMKTAQSMVAGKLRKTMRTLVTTAPTRWARRSLRKLFPGIGDVAFEAEWYGKIGMTADNLPRFHRLADNVVGFSGYNGRGIAPGTVFGRTLAELVSGRIAEAEGCPAVLRMQ